MKVLYLVSGIGPPAGWGTEFIQELIFELSKKGVKATIINPVYIHTPSGVEAWTRKQEKQYKIRIINFRLPRLFESLPLQLAITPLYTTLLAAKIMSKGKFDLIHEFSSTPIILFRAFIFRLFFKTPTIFTLSVYNNTILGRLFWIKFFDFVKYYMVPARELIDKIKSLGVSGKKLVYSPPGINLTRFRKTMDKTEARKKLGLPQNKFIFVYYGSLTKEKGAYDLIHAAKLLRNDIRKDVLIALFAVWKGSKEHAKIKNLLHSIKLPHLKLVEKYVDIPTLLAAADAVVLPAQTGHGATIPPISVVEALASGKPIIATDILGTRGLIGETNVILTSPKDPGELVQVIEKVHSERENYFEGSKKSGKRLEDFKLEKSVALHLSIYKRLISLVVR